MKRALRIPPGIFQPPLFEQTRFARTRFFSVGVGSDDMHFDLAGTVAAKHSAVLDQYHLGAIARRRDCRANTRKPTANNAEICDKVMISVRFYEVRLHELRLSGARPGHEGAMNSRRIFT